MRGRETMETVKINQVTKKFLTGNLQGLSVKEKTFQPFEEGKIYSCCVTGDRYIIAKVEEVDFILQ
jgi:hypothetical protein